MSEIIEGSVGTEPVGEQPTGVGVLRTTYGQKGIKKSGVGFNLSMSNSGIGETAKMGSNSKHILTNTGEPLTTSDGDRIVWD